MTRPTDTEIAALLRELTALADEFHADLKVDPNYKSYTHTAAAINSTTARARAMAEKLEPPANG